MITPSDLARELGVSTTAVLERARALGMDGAGPATGLVDADVDRLRASLSAERPPPPNVPLGFTGAGSVPAPTLPPTAARPPAPRPAARPPQPPVPRQVLRLAGRVPVFFLQTLIWWLLLALVVGVVWFARATQG